MRPSAEQVAEGHDAEDHAGDFERINQSFEPAAGPDLHSASPWFSS